MFSDLTWSRSIRGEQVGAERLAAFMHRLDTEDVFPAPDEVEEPAHSGVSCAVHG